MRWSMLTWIIRFAAFAIALMVLILSLEPSQGPGLPYVDKVMHFLAYGLIAGLIFLGWPSLKLWRVVLIATIFGICVEMAQGMTNLGRTPSILDAVANFAGALTSCFILQFLGQIIKNEKK